MKNAVRFVSMSVLALIVGCGQNEFTAEASPNFANLVSSTADSDKIAVGIVYDASGSMDESVKNENGQNEQKYQIANRAILNIGRRLDNYLAVNSNRIIAINIVLVKDGRASIHASTVLKGEASPFFEKWVTSFPGVGGGTPLGYGIDISAKQNAAYPSITRRHVMAITDGLSNSGPAPETFVAAYKKDNNSLGFHFITFDISADVFKPLKDLGSTVVESFNEKELNEKLNYVLTEKILLEREE